MRTKSSPATTVLTISLIVAASIGCAARSATDIKGPWKPLNRFAEATEAMPLRQPYMFYPSPADGTLKAMLTRWARDTNRTLSYQHTDDFTLHMPVTQIRTSDLQDALSLLTKIYADQRVSITASQKEIVVTTSEPNTARASVGNEAIITD